MKELKPFFILNGIRYEIMATRYLLAEYNKLSEEADLPSNDKANVIKAQYLMGEIQKYAEKTKELEEKFFETFDTEDERKYLAVKALYEDAFEQLARLESETGSTVKAQKQGVDLLEKIAIKGLAEQYFNFDETKAKLVWEKYVDTLSSNDIAVEWLISMSECLFHKEEEVDENSFLAQMRKKAETQAINRKKGLKKK